MINQKYKDQVRKANHSPSVFATVLIILSGLILYLDKIFVFFNIQLSNNHGFQGTEAFVWSLSQTLSPIIMLLGLYLKPFKEALIIPLYCYVIQLWFVLDSSLTIDRPLTWLYVTGTVIFIVLLALGINKMIIRNRELSRLKENIMEKIISTDDQLFKKKEYEK